MIFNLAYGKSGYTIELADHYNIDIIEPRWTESVSDPHLAIVEALKNPYNSKPLKAIVNNSDKVAIVFNDITRATPYSAVLPALLNELQNIDQGNICFFCANGTHRQETDQELIDILGENIVKNYQVIQNDVTKPELFEFLGTTKSGNDIFLNKEILKYKIKILTGFIEPHFFAGFSGGGKALIPGLASVESIKYNHSIKQLSNPNAKWGITNGNPLWEEITEAAEFVPGLFLLNITLNRRKEITNVFAGDLRTAHEAGCNFVKNSAMVPADKLYDLVITSNSGYPLDLNIYQSVKGMSAAAQIIKEGGNIIIAAECRDGIPADSDYEKILASANCADDLMQYINQNESTLKDTWQIYFQAMIQQKAKVWLFSDRLEDETIKSAHLNPVDDITRLTDELVRKIGPDAKICIMPEGPQTIPYFEGD